KEVIHPHLNNPRAFENVKNTRWKKGQSGNPNGRPRQIPKLDVLLADVMGQEDEDGVPVAQQIWQKLCDMALMGNVRAAEVVLDRTYGKAWQSLIIKPDEETAKQISGFLVKRKCNKQRLTTTNHRCFGV